MAIYPKPPSQVIEEKWGENYRGKGFFWAGLPWVEVIEVDGRRLLRIDRKKAEDSGVDLTVVERRLVIRK